MNIISDKVDKKGKKKEEPGSFFQRQRVDLLLGELAKKFPPKFVAPTQPGPEVKGICCFIGEILWVVLVWAIQLLVLLSVSVSFVNYVRTSYI